MSKKKLITKIKKVPRWLKRHLNKKRLIVIGIITFLVLIKLISSAKSGLKVEVAEVKKGDLIESFSSSGEVTAEKLAYMYFPTAGKVAWLSVSEGDKVKKYQALASLDKTALDAAYQQAQNMVRKYSATVDNIHDSLKNKDSSETFAERDIRTSAEATNDYYYNALRTAEYNLQNATLIAPFDGIISSFATGLSVGANVLGTSPAFIAVDPQTVYLKAEVDESDVTKIFPGQEVQVELDAFPSETFTTKVKTVDFVNSVTSSGGKAYKIAVELPENKELRFKLGMNGDARFILSKKENILTIPQTAIFEEEEKTYVWGIKNHKAVKKEIKIGISSLDETEVISGLSVGEKTIINASTKIKEGTKIKYVSSN
jgi:HlyD family secretion protein